MDQAVKEMAMTSETSQAVPRHKEPRRIGTVVPIRCLVVDDHPAVRAGLRDLLGDDPRFEVLEAVSNAEDAVAFAEHEQIDVAIVDYRLEGRTGLWVCRKLKRLACPPRVLMYSAYSDGALAAGCVIAEADGLVSKSRVDVELRDAICDVVGGVSRLPAIPPAVAESLRQRLDVQEQAVFGLLGAGTPLAQIAVTLDVSRAELEACLRRMLGKLDLWSVVE